jgi:DNA repair protein RecO
MIVTTEAIILKSLKYRDTSKLLTVYTEQFGRCSLIAHSARKPKNKFGSALEITACSRLTFYKHPAKELHTLSAAEIALPLRGITESFERLTVALSIAEALLSTQHDEEQNAALYGLVKSTLHHLNTLEHNAHTLLAWFQIRLAEQVGFALNPHYYAASSEEIFPEMAAEFVLSLADGAPCSPVSTLHTTSALQQTNGTFRVEAGTLAVLQRLERIPKEHLQQATMIQLSAKQQQQLGDFFSLYYQYHLSRFITGRTRRFLRDAQL